MFTKLITGFMASSQSTSSANHSYVPYKNGENDTTYTSTLIVLLLLAGLVWMETTANPDVIVKSTPLEQKYDFATLEDCKAKLVELKTQHNISDIRCVPNEHNRNSTNLPKP